MAEQDKNKMKIYWNPFAFIKETNASPHARTLRTDLKDKFSDTFRVLNGGAVDTVDINGSRKEIIVNVDLLDYLTLGIPKLFSILLQKMLDNLFNKDDKTPFWIKVFSGIFIIPVGIPALLMIAAKSIATGIMTLALSPLISLVHIVSQNKGAEYKKEAVKIIAENPENPNAADYKRLGTTEILAHVNDEDNIEIEKRNYENFGINLNDNAQEETVKKSKTALLKLNIGNVLGNFEEKHPHHKIDIEKAKVTLTSMIPKK